MKLDAARNKIFMIFAVIALIFLLSRVFSATQKVEVNSDIGEDISIKTTTTIAGNDIIKVYICGEITNEGVYEISKDDRLADLIEKAGGLTAEACKDNLNLAMKMADGEKIKIYSIEDSENENSLNENYTGVDKINHMNLEDLKELPGIGDKIGEEILAYIDANGPISDYQQLLEIEGIGESKLKKIIESID